jgi:predicted DNA-binding transcriptional regulator AlpA
MENLLNRRETCVFFGRIDPSTLYRHIKKGLLPKPLKVGGSSRWLRDECEAALTEIVEARQ